MPNMYAEFVSVRRHVLQCEADDEADLLEKMVQHARGQWVDGLQVSDDDTPVLLHEPFGSNEVGPSEDGPFLYAGSPFGQSTHWMREAAEQLMNLADDLDAERKMS